MSSIPPGWYADPQTDGQLRYWDGSGWTEHLQPLGPGAAAPEPAPLFTADLSVDDLLAVEQSGYEPVGVVAGSSLRDVTLPRPAPESNQEVGPLSTAMSEARELALERMREDAARLEADGVVGVRLEMGGYEWAPRSVEFVARGTAVRLRRGEPGDPFTTALSGTELAKLRTAGYRPVAVAIGICVQHVAYQALARPAAGAGEELDLDAYALALAGARDLALERMRDEARSAGAEGVVGVGTRERSHGWGSHVVELLAIGSAVAREGAQAVSGGPGGA